MCKKLICLFSFVLLLGLAPTSVAQDTDSSLVGWWKFDEGFGDVALDSSDNNNEMTLIGEPTWGTDPEHRGIMVFDGVDDHAYIEGTPFELPNYTIALWFRIDGGSGDRDILSAKGPSGVNGVLLEIEPDGTLRNLHRFPFASGGGSNIYTEATYDDGAWHHVAALKSDTEMMLYVDGTQVGSEPDTTQFEGSLGEIWLGTLDQRVQRMLPGAIDDMRIYNRVLTEQEIQAIMAGQAEPLAYAPQPADAAILEQTWANLSWGAGDYAASHNLYFSINFDDVNDGTDEAFAGNTIATIQVVGFPGFSAPDGLQFGATYYWRIDEVNELHPDSPWKGDIWSFTVPPQKAYSPNPPDGARFLEPELTLTWMPAFGTKLHSIYFGDNFDDVSNAEGAASRVASTYDTGLLELEKTYYWRVDEFDGVETYRGDVWSFTTTSPGGGLRGEYYNNSTLSGEPVLIRSDPGIDFTWGTASPEPNIVNDDNFSMRWRGEVEIAFSEAYRFYVVTEDGVKLWINDKLVIDRWDVFRLNEYRTNPIDLQAGQKYAIEMWSYSDEPGATAQLLWESEHQSKDVIPAAAFSPPLRAGAPNPTNEAIDVSQTAILEWSAGEAAAVHQVYFGTNEDAVKSADTSSTEYKGTRDLGTESYDPGKLPWDTTYYWRIDEVNDLNQNSPWTGAVWSFTTANFLIVDDFESYNDFNPDDPESNRIFNAWIDGFDNPAINGSIVGYANPPFAERNIVHGGFQSMPFAYDNAVGISEATLTLTSNRDWTESSVNTLVIWYIGDAANTLEPMYVVLNGTAAVTNDNPNATQEVNWTQWNIDLQVFADQGVNLTNVNAITLGVGNKNNPVAGGAGMLYFDDIRLYTLTQ
ncbi:MAG: LamG-like jellyroll fold domain-containing protein [Sedimentisphaerales bacterium]|nr:LamG-like jellyroll fold domain-containing protein [Sedimentisphaerales bacterium]